MISPKIRSSPRQKDRTREPAMLLRGGRHEPKERGPAQHFLEARRHASTSSAIAQRICRASSSCSCCSTSPAFQGEFLQHRFVLERRLAPAQDMQQRKTVIVARRRNDIPRTRAQQDRPPVLRQLIEKALHLPTSEPVDRGGLGECAYHPPPRRAGLRAPRAPHRNPSPAG